LPSFPLHGRDKTSEFWNGKSRFQTTSKPPKLDSCPSDQPGAKNLSPSADTCHLRKNKGFLNVETCRLGKSSVAFRLGLAATAVVFTILIVRLTERL